MRQGSERFDGTGAVCLDLEDHEEVGRKEVLVMNPAHPSLPPSDHTPRQHPCRSWAVWAAGSLSLQLSQSLAADATLYATTTPVSWQVCAIAVHTPPPFIHQTTACHALARALHPLNTDACEGASLSLFLAMCVGETVTPRDASGGGSSVHNAGGGRNARSWRWAAVVAVVAILCQEPCFNPDFPYAGCTRMDMHPYGSWQAEAL